MNPLLLWSILVVLPLMVMVQATKGENYWKLINDKRGGNIEKVREDYSVLKAASVKMRNTIAKCVSDPGNTRPNATLADDFAAELAGYFGKSIPAKELSVQKFGSGVLFDSDLCKNKVCAFSFRAESLDPSITNVKEYVDTNLDAHMEAILNEERSDFPESNFEKWTLEAEKLKERFGIFTHEVSRWDYEHILSPNFTGVLAGSNKKVAGTGGILVHVLVYQEKEYKALDINEIFLQEFNEFKGKHIGGTLSGDGVHWRVGGRFAEYIHYTQPNSTEPTSGIVKGHEAYHIFVEVDLPEEAPIQEVIKNALSVVESDWNKSTTGQVRAEPFNMLDSRPENLSLNAFYLLLTSNFISFGLSKHHSGKKVVAFSAILTDGAYTNHWITLDEHIIQLLDVVNAARQKYYGSSYPKLSYQVVQAGRLPNVLRFIGTGPEKSGFGVLKGSNITAAVTFVRKTIEENSDYWSVLCNIMELLRNEISSLLSDPSLHKGDVVPTFRFEKVVSDDSQFTQVWNSLSVLDITQLLLESTTTVKFNVQQCNDDVLFTLITDLAPQWEMDLPYNVMSITRAVYGITPTIEKILKEEDLLTDNGIQSIVDLEDPNAREGKVQPFRGNGYAATYSCKIGSRIDEPAAYLGMSTATIYTALKHTGLNRLNGSAFGVRQDHATGVYTGLFLESGLGAEAPGHQESKK